MVSSLCYFLHLKLWCAGLSSKTWITPPARLIACSLVTIPNGETRKACASYVANNQGANLTAILLLEKDFLTEFLYTKSI